MKSGGRTRARGSQQSREDAAYEKRRWEAVLEDLANRPALERAQAEAIARKALTLMGDTDERRRDVEKAIIARFGALPVAPQPVPKASAPAPAEPRRRMAQQALLTAEWLEPVSAPAPAPRPSRRRARAQPSPVVAPSGLEKRFRELVLHIGLDAAFGVLRDLELQFGSPRPV